MFALYIYIAMDAVNKYNNSSFFKIYSYTLVQVYREMREL